MKQIIIILSTIFLTTTVVKAQNTAMAKAYFEKAKKIYRNNERGSSTHMTELVPALKAIENCKEQIGGETNPDIKYLEAQIRYYTDLNINKTKQLLNEFINEAFEDDDRIEDAAKLLIEIEQDENLYANGFKKSGTIRNVTDRNDFSNNEALRFYRISFGGSIRILPITQNYYYEKLYFDNNGRIKYSNVNLISSDEYFTFYYDHLGHIIKVQEYETNNRKILLCTNYITPEYIFLIAKNEIYRWNRTTNEEIVWAYQYSSEYNSFDNLTEYSSRVREIVSRFSNKISNGAFVNLRYDFLAKNLHEITIPQIIKDDYPSLKLFLFTELIEKPKYDYFKFYTYYLTDSGFIYRKVYGYYSGRKKRRKFNTIKTYDYKNHLLKSN